MQFHLQNLEKKYVMPDFIKATYNKCEKEISNIVRKTN